MAGLFSRNSTPKRKRSPRTRYSPEQKAIQIENRFLQELKNADFETYRGIMLQRVMRRGGMGATAATATAPEDALRDKLVDLALAQMQNAGPNSLKTNLETMKLLMSFAEALPGRGGDPSVLTLVQSAIEKGPEYLSALKNTILPTAGADPAQLAAPAAPQRREALPPATIDASATALPPAAAPPAPAVAETPPTDPIADLIGRLAPLLDKPPAEAAEELYDVIVWAQENNHPGSPFVTGLLDWPMGSITLLLQLQLNHVVYGPIARRLLSPEGQVWLKDVRQLVQQIDKEQAEAEVAGTPAQG